MLLRPTLVTAGEAVGRHWVALIGFGGGLVGGVTAMPGAIPTIWCDMRRHAQERAARPGAALHRRDAALCNRAAGRTSGPVVKVFVDLAISLPALFAGSVLGVIAFHRVNETVFRKTVLVLLLVSGISLI